MSRQFFTSDLHLFHEMVMHLRGFATSEEQVASLRDAWCSRVTKRDTVYVLGDLCLARLSESLSIIASLPGTKHLIFGNHDAGHPAHRKAFTAQQRYAGYFASASVQAQVNLHGNPFLLNHLPYDGEGDKRPDLPERYSQWRFKDMGAPLIHGHTHSATRFSRSALGSPQIHIGLDAFGALASADDVLDLYHSN